MDVRPEISDAKPRRRGLRSLIWLGLFAFLLFIPAGTARWPGAWVYLAILAVATVWGFGWLERHDPALLAERLRPPIQRGQPLTDKLLMGAFLPLWFGWFVLMGLDRRFGWSSLPVALEILGAVLLCLGIWLSFEVLKENSYAAPVVKVQKERGHSVVCTGPYAYVRHPPYAYVRHPMCASVLLIGTGAPLLLGSWWGLLGVPLFMRVLGARAVMEERVRYRFVPRFW